MTAAIAGPQMDALQLALSVFRAFNSPEFAALDALRDFLERLCACPSCGALFEVKSYGVAQQQCDRCRAAEHAEDESDVERADKLSEYYASRGRGT